ncbi:MAG: primosomal protein N' [Anaerolineae bacterium]
MTFAEVVVDRPILRRQSLLDVDFPEEAEAPLSEDEADPRTLTFHYHIPPHLKKHIRVGHWVSVPFRHEELRGVVVALADTAPVADTRPLSELLDPDPVLTPIQIELAYWLSREYLAPLSTCIKPFLPPRAGPKLERTVELLIPPDEIEAVLPTLGRASKQAEVLLHLAGLDDPLPALAEVTAAVGCSEGPVRALAGKGWVELIPRQTLIGTRWDKGSAVEGLARNEAQAAALRLLIRKQRPVPLPELTAQVSGLARADVKAMEEAGLITRFEEPPRVVLSLPPARLNEAVIQLRGSQRQAQVLDLLAMEDGPIWIGWVYAQTEANIKVLRDLAARKLIALKEARRWRDPLAGRTFALEAPPRLTQEQAQVWQTIEENSQWRVKGRAKQSGPRKPIPYLLHGVTGSGKTEIYLRAIERALQAGRGAIMLVPEIALTAQAMHRLAVRFPGKVAVWHSALSPGERYDTWQRIRSGKLPVVVGPRSALFAPLPDVGVIIVDEEHEPAYKQHDRAPTFHAREAAIKLGQLTNAVVILGSATPDVASYRQAQRGAYRLLALPNRILAHRKHLAVQRRMAGQPRRSGRQPERAVAGGSGPRAVETLPLPPVEIVDLREELKAGNRSIFSRALVEEISETLEAGEQVILFLNRRGAATFVICRDCGYVMQCPRCDTTLTYHSTGDIMACHYCGYRRAPMARCPECDGQRIRYFGLGTQRVEEALRELFPQARPLRWDQDTASRKGSHETFLQHFSEGRANVLIGTQMVAKGLDLPLVTLVGVISADTMLYLPDFRAAERTFQLLMQIAGRAGRSPLGGRVIIQTYTPEQPAIQAAAAHDYLTFYEDELRFRYEQRYPPFKRLARLLYIGQGRERSRREAEAMVRRLRVWADRQGLPGVEIVGPAPGYVQRVGSRFRWQVLVRSDDPSGLLRRWVLPLGWRVDVDPVNLG